MRYPHDRISATLSQMGVTDTVVAMALHALLLRRDGAPRQRCFHCRVLSAAVQPVEGLNGEWECLDVPACEARLLSTLRENGCMAPSTTVANLPEAAPAAVEDAIHCEESLCTDIAEHHRLALMWEFVFGPVPELAAAALIKHGYADE